MKTLSILINLKKKIITLVNLHFLLFYLHIFIIICWLDVTTFISFHQVLLWLFFCLCSFIIICWLDVTTFISFYQVFLWLFFCLCISIIICWLHATTFISLHSLTWIYYTLCPLYIPRLSTQPQILVCLTVQPWSLFCII